MTLLEDKVLPLRNKLSLRATNQLKRKAAYDPLQPTKRPYAPAMLNGYKSDQHRPDAAHDTPVATLSNMGNTCYLNSVLYTLRFAPTFLHNLHHLIGDLSVLSARLSLTKARTSSLGRNVAAITGPSARSTSSKDLPALAASDLPKTRVQVVTERLHELYATMRGLEAKDLGERHRPEALLQAVRDANSIFEGNHQQDAHELLVYLLDNIRETCDFLSSQVQSNPALLTDAEIIPTGGASKMWSVRRSWKKGAGKRERKEVISEEMVNGACATDTEDTCSNDSNFTDNCKKKLGYNFVTEDFEGITLRRTRCLECEGVTERKEPFYDIPVPISLCETEMDDGAINPNDFFRRACVTSEKLCDSNKYLCEKCQQYNEASREVLFEKLPNIMVLQLKRFTTSADGVGKKVNTFLPTPLNLECFCETCCQAEDTEAPPHRYRLCCVIMHLGESMVSGHYIAYVKASDHMEDYAECSRNAPKGSLSASSSEKSLNFFKYIKQRTIASGLFDNKGGSFNGGQKQGLNGVKMCKSMDCCGVKMNKSVVDNAMNSYSNKKRQDYYGNGAVEEDVWLECDDDIVRPITSQEMREELAYKPNSTSTPYLLFYAKNTDGSLN